MAFPQGINLRANSGYVTDPANYDYFTISHCVYPFTSAQGNTVGMEGNIGVNAQFRDRNSGNDPRNAGAFFDTSGTEDLKIRIDLPSAGNYNIGLSSGDANYVTGTALDVYDTTTILFSLTGLTSAAQRFKDATGTEYTNVTWPTSQSLVTETFTTSILRFGGAADFNSVYVEASGTPVRVGSMFNIFF